MTKMKAAMFLGHENIEIQEIPIPNTPEDGVLIKVIQCGLCGGDIRNFYAGLRYGVKQQIMGHEIVAIVEDVGKNCSALNIKDRIALAPDVHCGTCYYCQKGLVNLCENHQMIGTNWPGGFSQYMAISGFMLTNGFVEKIPENISFDEAVLAEPLSSVIACQELNNIKNCTLGIIGSGPIGYLHTEVAKANNCSLIALIGRSRLEMAHDFPVDVIVDATKNDPIKAAYKATNGIGLDFVICANPAVETQQQAIEMVRKQGTVILFGGVPKHAPMTSLNSNMIHYDEIRVIGSFSYPKNGLKRALSYIAQGKVTSKKYITHKMPLDHIVAAIQLAKTRKALKIVLDPWM